MKPKEKVFDDIARMAGGAVSIMNGLTKQAREEIRTRVDEFATRLDLVPREDFERLEAVLAQARREQSRLEERLEKLEKQLSGGAKKSAPKKAAGKKKTK